MARRGENIYKRKDNRWEGRYIKGYDLSGKAQYGYVYSSTYRGVREKLQDARNGIIMHNRPVRKTLSHFCDEWLCLCRNRVKESTFVKYSNIINRHIRPALGSCFPGDLSTLQIESFSNNLLQSGLATKTVKDILTVLRSILRYTHTTEKLSTPPLEIVYPKEKKSEMRVLTMSEQNRFVKFLMTDMNNVKFGVLLALMTGMRIGEICALRWENIIMDENIIKVSSTMQRLQNLDNKKNQKTKITIGDTKSESSSRIIPLSASASELCEKMRPAHGTGFVLTGNENEFMEPRLLQYHMKRFTKACDLDGVHFHTLRHTFATRCIEVGFEVKSLSEILGHSDIRVTLERYVHSSIELKRANMDKLAAIGM